MYDYLDRIFMYLLIIYLVCVVGVIYGLITDITIVKQFIFAGLITVSLAVIVILVGMNNNKS